MDFETWTDKNGTKWKVAEMTTRQIKKVTFDLYKESLRLMNLSIMYSRVANNKGEIAFCKYWNTCDWLNRFKTELERRKQNG